MKKNESHVDRTREKIKTTMVISRLVSHVDGKTEMSATQVRAAEILLKKTLPDLQSIDMGVSGDMEMKKVPEITQKEARSISSALDGDY